jgi:hypothetical protein
MSKQSTEDEVFKFLFDLQESGKGWNGNDLQNTFGFDSDLANSYMMRYCENIVMLMDRFRSDINPSKKVKIG